jgi:hypothetical protein
VLVATFRNIGVCFLVAGGQIGRTQGTNGFGERGPDSVCATIRLGL